MAKEIIITGIVLILLGIFLLVITKFHTAGMIYGIMSIILGLILTLWNKEEDKIEKRRDK
jgi:uncharacterized membrane protein